MDGTAREAVFVSMGNPHAVFFVDDIEHVDLAHVGPRLERHGAFPQRMNVHFVQVSGENELLMRAWERGAGATDACGSGAVVAADIFHRWGLVGPKVVVRMPGGDALVSIGPPTTITGPSTHIADIEIDHG